MGGILGAITGSKKATKRATAAANEAAASNERIATNSLNTITGYIDPYAKGGLGAVGLYNDLLGIPQAPGSNVTPGSGQAAFQNYLDNFGFTNDLQQGSQAITGNAAARRNLGSGATLKSLQRFGTGLRDQYRGNFLNSLGNQQAMGLNAAGSLAGAQTNYTGQMINNNNNRASVIGNAALAGAASNTNFLGSALGAAAMLSDRRAKTDIKRIGELKDGTKIYSYKYRGSDAPQVGVMAQEIRRTHPDAVEKGDDGLYRVRYANLLESVSG